MVSLLVVQTGCRKEFLDTTPPDGISIEDFYTTAAEAELGLVACYDNLSAQFDRLYGLGVDAIGLYCGDLCLSSWTTRWNKFEINTQDGSEETVRIVWNECYQGIYRCNVLLENIEPLDMDGIRKAEIIGETKFLRAFYYFDLVRTFGDVPLVLSPLSPEESYVSRDPKSAVVAQMITDFNDAIAALPEKSQWSGADMGRATKGSARAYLMKLYCYEQQWGNAVSVGQDLINSEEYELFDEYTDNFSISDENGVESVFEIQCLSNQGTEGNAHNDLEGTEGTPFPRGNTAPFEEFVNSFELNADGVVDPRREATLYDTFNTPTFFGAQKYQIGASNGIAYDAENNYKLMRYSDALLLYAEALNESGSTQEALTYLNLVRQRPSVNMPAVTSTDQQVVREAIRDERKWELGLEGHRFFDLVRWGIAGETIRAQGRTFIDGVHEIMPLPINELDINENLTQNPGY